MNRLLIISAFLFSLSAYAQNKVGYTLYSNTGTAYLDSKYTLPVFIDNEESICNLQFDITLPSGVDISCGMDEGETLLITKGERAKASHTIACHKMSEKCYRVVVSSSDNAIFNDADKTLPMLNITFDVSSDATVGKNDITFTHIVVSHYDASINKTSKHNVSDAVATIQIVKVHSIKVSSNDAALGLIEISGDNYDPENELAYDGSEVTLTAKPKENCTFLQWVENGKELSADNPYTLTLTSDRDIQAVFAKYGDSNADGFINVNDITNIATYILKGKAEGFYMKSADINRDGFINVNDITGVAKYILTGKY